MSEHSRFAGTVIRLGAIALVAAALLAGCTSGKDGTPGAPGSAGPPGTAGTPGQPGPVLALDISTAQTVKATITGITAGSQPKISFTLVDQNGQPLSGLQCPQIHFGIAALVPGANGGSSYWQSYINSVETAGTGPWNSLPTGQTAATARARQASTEPGFAGTCPGTFKDNGDGTYTYQFAKDLGSYTAAGPNPTDLAISYQGTLTHRVGLELRGTGPNGTDNGVNNAAYTYVPATGLPTGLPASREIVSNTECYACHDKLAIHGGPRTDVQYCVICHNPGSSDAQSGNTVDFKVLVHKLHTGIKLPTVVAAGKTDPAPNVGYTIWGFGNSLNNFNTVVWPQDQRNCTTCHNTAADSDNYETVVNRAACGTCHDDINFDTGAGHVQFSQNPGGISQPDDSKCLSCHGKGSGVISPISGYSVEVAAAHVVPEQVLAAGYTFKVVKVEPTTDAAGLNIDTTACPPSGSVCLIPPGDYAKVTIMVTDATGKAIDLATDPGFKNTSYVPGATPTANVTAPSITVNVAYTTANYTGPSNPQNTSASRSPPQTIRLLAYATTTTAAAAAAGPAGLAYAAATVTNGVVTATSGNLPAKNADGSYSKVTLYPVKTPTPTTALFGINGNVSGAVLIEGRAVRNVAAAGQPASNSVVGIDASAPLFFPISLPTGATKAAPRRLVVDFNNCAKCHNKDLKMHGEARNSSAALCVVCHNPEMTTGSFPPPAPPAPPAVPGPVQAPAGPMDFKFLIHGLHAGTYNYGSHNFTRSAASPTPVVDFALDFSTLPVGFPGAINDCEACHVKGADTFYPVDSSKVFATTVWGNSATAPATAVGPGDDLAITPNVAACGACHVTTLAQAHMKQNGGVIIDPATYGYYNYQYPTGTFTLIPDYKAQVTAMGGSIKNPDGTTKAAYQTESCGVCHGPGAVADVKIVHNIAAYQ
jgi:hypothetical protein